MQELIIFKELTTSSVLAELAEVGDSYEGLYVDMSDAKQRKFVKGQAEKINTLLKTLDANRIAKTKESKSVIDKEFNLIVDSLTLSNKPFTLLIEEYKVERKRILDEEKRVQAVKDAYFQAGIDHTEAINENELHDLRIEKQQRELKENEERLLAESKAEAEALAIKVKADNERTLQLAETKRLFDLEQAETKAAKEKQDAIDLAAKLERDRIQAETKAAKDLVDAENKRLADIESTKQQEQAKQKAEQQRIADELAQREANQAHVIAICKAAKESLMAQCGLSEEDAIKVVKATRAGLIQNMVINF